jgi:pyruvate dehydrogenase E1 component beta subunit
MVHALNRALAEAIETDRKVLVFGEDVGQLGGVFRVTDALQQRFGADRVFDTPIAESGIVGMAIGLAINGFRPVVELQFDGFSYPALNQIITHVGRYRTRTHGQVTLPMVIRMPFAGGVGATEHHSESPEVFFAHTPGLKVVVASSALDAYQLLTLAIRNPDPVVLLESKARYWIRDNVDLEQPMLPIDKARVVRTGADCSIIAYGPPVHTALEVAAAAKADGIDIEVVDIRSLVPLDMETILSSVRKTKRAVVVHEAPMTAGFGAELAARISEELFLEMEAPVLRVTGYDIPYPAPTLEKFYLPGAERIASAVRRSVSVYA